MNDIKKQKMIYRAMIGWSAGMLVGMLGAAIISIMYIENNWLKFFSGLGLFSASLATVYGLITTWGQYNLYCKLNSDVPTETKPEEEKQLRLPVNKKKGDDF